MKCPKCQGFVVRDQLFDPDGPFLHIAILRCLNCGSTIYLDDKKDEVPCSDPSRSAPSKAA